MGGFAITQLIEPATDDAAFDAYAEQVDVYSRTWFSAPNEPQKTFLSTRPSLKAALFQRAIAGQHTFTGNVYEDDAGWHPERRDLQDSLVAQQLEGGTGAQGAKDAVYILIGLPGSGKSTALRPLAYRHAGLEVSDFSVSDADALRAEFPEYSSGLGSGVVQDECSELMYQRQFPSSPAELGLQGAILQTGRTTIVDVIGHPEYLPVLVKRLRRTRRQVFVLQASCSLETCMSRAKTRALASGRLVPPSFIETKAGIPEQALEAAKSTGKLSGWAVVDTNGQDSRIVASYRFDVPAPAP
jgi:hypothetical protein